MADTPGAGESGVMEALAAVGMLDFLEQDRRPTFVLDLHDMAEADVCLRPVFLNGSLQEHADLCRAITGEPGFEFHTEAGTMTYPEFTSWSSRQHRQGDGSPAIVSFNGVLWESVVVSRRWKVVLTNSFLTSNHLYSQRGIPNKNFVETGPDLTLPSPKHISVAQDGQDSDVERTVSMGDLMPQKRIHSGSDGTKVSRESGSTASDAEMRDILEKVPVGMVFCTPDGYIQQANNMWCALTEYPGHESDPHNIESLILEEDFLAVSKEWTSILATKSPISFQCRLKNSSTSSLTGREEGTWVTFIGIADSDIHGNVRGVFGTLFDISRFKERSDEADKYQARYMKMTELAPIGMVFLTPEGMVTYANDVWLELTNHPRNLQTPLSFVSCIAEDDLGLISEQWALLAVAKISVSFECRLRKPWKDPLTGEIGDTWILSAAVPEIVDGEMVSVYSCVTDISAQKWAERVQTQRMEDAILAKRRQEDFIDFTSHEMRNPLGAIIHCADEIVSSLKGPISANILQSSIDAAEIVADCAIHSTRMVDDILTMSKLQSNMLHITPVLYRPIAAIPRALKMFDGELRRSDISMSLLFDESFHTFQVDWIMIDPSRLFQVLVNLISNAIKFTKPRLERKLSITVSASSHMPSASENPIVDYLPHESSGADLTLRPDWGNDESLFLQFAVADTGCGLSAEEKQVLFSRFTQASARTHVSYGGSGLGLYISRQLSEMQGGQIGVRSQQGEGSTFAFFIKTRRAPAPVSFTVSDDEALTMENGRVVFGGSRTVPPVVQDTTAIPPVVENVISQINSAIAAGDRRPVEILVVEDNLVNQKVLTQQLHKLDFSVRVANHGEEALERIKETRLWQGNENSNIGLSIILMDVEMPVMDGLTCVRRIRDLQASGLIRRHIPVIAITANAREQQISKAKEAGMDDVITKPFRLKTILPQIERFLVQYPDDRIS